MAGEKDPLVKFEWQKAGIEQLKKINGCDADGKPWKHHKLGTIYQSKTGTPVVTFIYNGNHTFPSKEAAPAIVKFFKDYAKK